jgi:hypothetical protein
VIPSALSEISVAQYQKLYELRDDPVGAVAYMRGVPRETMAKTAHKTVAQHARALKALLEQKPNELQTRFVLDGVEFRMLQDWANVTTAEYIDLEAYCMDPIANAHKIMGVIYRPVAKMDQWGWYALEEYVPDKYAEPMRRVPADVFGAAVLFFCLNADAYKTILLHSLSRGVLEVQSQAITGGTTPSTSLRAKIRSKWTRWKNGRSAAPTRT